MRSTVLIAFPMIAALLWLGGVTEGAMIVAAAGVAVALALEPAGRDGRRPVQARIVSFALWGMVAVCVLQLIPIPARMLAVLAPSAEQAWSGAANALGIAPSARPITMDPPGTIFVGAQATIVAAFFELASREACQTGGRTRLARAVVTAVVCVDLIALAHPLLGLTRLYGAYQPMHIFASGQPILAPLLNPNHAAALSCVAPPLLIGFAIETEDVGGRVLAAVGAATCGAVAVLSLSRSGMAILCFETVLMGGYLLLRRGPLRRRLVTLFFGLTAAAIAIAAAMYVAFDSIIHEASDNDLTKFRIAQRAYAMAKDHLWFGVGRGAFGSSFGPYELPMAEGTRRFTHPEHWPAQLLTEVGAPVAIAFCGALAVAFVMSMRTTVSRPTYVGATVALVGLALHDLADFALEFLGVALIAACLLAIVTGSRVSSIARPKRSMRRMLIVAPVAAAVALLPNYHHSDDEDDANIASAWQAGNLGAAEPTVRAAILRHPMDPYFHMVLGVIRLRTAEAAPHLLRAVKLGPHRALGHLWLARWFVAAGRRGQAWAEYREALRLSSLLGPTILDDMVRASAPLDDVLSVAVGPLALESASFSLRRYGRDADAIAADEHQIALWPPAVEARVRQIERMHEVDPATARVLADELIAAAPSSARGYLLRATLEDDPVAAETELSRGLAVLHDDPALLEDLIRRRGERSGLEAVKDEIDRLKGALLLRDGTAFRLLAIEGDVELARHQDAAALTFYLDAATASPDGLQFLESAARLAEKLERYELALSAWQRLVDAHPGDRRLADELARVRSVVAGRANDPPLDLPLPSP